MSDVQTLAQPPHRLLLVTLNITIGQPNIDVWQARFNNATDWYRYAPNCWFLWTSGTTQSWFAYLKPFVAASDSLAILDITRSDMIGLLPKGAWEWLGKHVPLRNPL